MLRIRKERQGGTVWRVSARKFFTSDGRVSSFRCMNEAPRKSTVVALKSSVQRGLHETLLAERHFLCDACTDRHNCHPHFHIHGHSCSGYATRQSCSPYWENRDGYFLRLSSRLLRPPGDLAYWDRYSGVAFPVRLVAWSMRGGALRHCAAQSRLASAR